MIETHFRWPGRYAMWREAGVLWLEVKTASPAGRRVDRVSLRPRLGYAFLMNRRRTELLYAVAMAMAAQGAFDDDALSALAEICGGGAEADVAALADRWNEDGVVAAVMAEILDVPLPGGDAPRWFAPRRRVVGWGG
ncbi:MAG: hypothetical protein AAFU72_10590 [Pseudomonadota bacterium]